jgi:hypothetical protein
MPNPTPNDEHHRPRKSKTHLTPYIAIGSIGLLLGLSLLFVKLRPGWAVWIALVDGLSVGTILGAVGLIPSYDDSWDEFFEATALACLLGVVALLVYLLRRERPSAFFLVECAAGTVSYLMLLFVPPLQWLGADLMLFAGTFVGWFFSGLFRPGYL